MLFRKDISRQRRVTKCKTPILYSSIVYQRKDIERFTYCGERFIMDYNPLGHKLKYSRRIPDVDRL